MLKNRMSLSSFSTLSLFKHPLFRHKCCSKIFPLFCNHKLVERLLYSCKKSFSKYSMKLVVHLCQLAWGHSQTASNPIELDLKLSFTMFGLVGLHRGCDSQQQRVLMAVRLNYIFFFHSRFDKAFVSVGV